MGNGPNPKGWNPTLENYPTADHFLHGAHPIAGHILQGGPYPTQIYQLNKAFAELIKEKILTKEVISFNIAIDKSISLI